MSGVWTVEREVGKEVDSRWSVGSDRWSRRSGEGRGGSGRVRGGREGQGGQGGQGGPRWFPGSSRVR